MPSDDGGDDDGYNEGNGFNRSDGGHHHQQLQHCFPDGARGRLVTRLAFEESEWCTEKHEYT
jgi:hypothetical protein